MRSQACGNSASATRGYNSQRTSPIKLIPSISSRLYHNDVPSGGSLKRGEEFSQITLLPTESALIIHNIQTQRHPNRAGGEAALQGRRARRRALQGVLPPFPRASPLVTSWE